MKKAFKILSFCTLIGYVTTSPVVATAQEGISDQISKKLETYTVNHLTEKLFVHTDKSTYLSNEPCWFKIYNVEGIYHTPMDISKVAYVEILDAQAKPIVQEMVKLENGTGNGSLTIPNNINTGNYTLRAYTNWMKNTDAAFFFEKKITLINTVQAQDYSASNEKEEISLQLFPEGGNLVADINNTVVLKAVNKEGVGIAILTYLLSAQNDTLQSITTGANGLAKFNFKPITQQQYKLIAKLTDGKIITQPISSIQANGYTMHVNNATESSIELKLNKTNLTSNNTYLIVHNRGIVKAAFVQNFNNYETNLTIPLEKLGNGVNVLTLFDENKRPVSERLYFKFPKGDMDLDVDMDVTEFKTRNQVKLSLLSRLENGNATPADLSMAVYKIDSLQGIDPVNIVNYLWLSSDLPTPIANPSIYFDEKNTNRAEAIDYVMLTQGWRKYKWEHILNEGNNTKPEFLPELVGKIITGKVVPIKENAPVNGIGTYLSIPSTHAQFRPSTSDLKGRVQFQFANFTSDNQVIAQLEGKYNKDYKLAIDNPFVKSNNKTFDKRFGFNRTTKFQLNQYHRNTLVQEHYNNNLANYIPSKSIDTTAFYNKADDIYLLDDYTRFNTLEEVFREYVSTVKLTKSKDDFDIAVFDIINKRFFNNQPLILLDGLAMTDLNRLMEYDPLKIRKMEIVNKLYFLGNSTYSGVINLTTYTGKLEGFELDPKSVVLDYKGLQTQREFMPPVYDKATLSRQPDFRHMLHWDPSISTGSNGKKELSFYTSDVPGKYVIVLQGINKNGQAGYKQLGFEVY